MAAFYNYWVPASACSPLPPPQQEQVGVTPPRVPCHLLPPATGGDTACREPLSTREAWTQIKQIAGMPERMPQDLHAKPWRIN